jgi:ADP-ribose pyrophosphatase
MLRDDAVTFPDGSPGRYVSIHASAAGSPAGVVILPMFGNRYVLCRQFRHATRRWELEAPRGFIDQGETAEAAALRELHEEYGVSSASLTHLGDSNADTGLLAFDVALFYCRLESIPALAGDHARTPPVLFTQAELQSAMRGNEVKDGYLLTALALAAARGLSPA